uniref:phosphoglycerate mutase family protein n=1 Tax=uncultured Draconibacterium sp. TaxID=1573823 RepID=UPI0032180ACF
MRIFIVFIVLNLFPAVTFWLNAQEIILIRHAEVQLDSDGWMGAKKAAEFRKEYDTAPIIRFDPESILAKLPKRITDTIYVSGLPRSIATGLYLFGDSANIVSMNILNEFEMHIIWLPVYLPYKGWTFLSRSLWLLGNESPGTESYRETKKRIQKVCAFIEKKASRNNQVILVTHGFLNRNIAKELKRRGWSRIQNDGKTNLGATILRKKQ